MISSFQILLGIQELLDSPNEKDPAQADAYQAYITNKTDYANRIRKQAQQYRNPNLWKHSIVSDLEAEFFCAAASEGSESS